jgi:ankyrin repeat protein
MTGTPEGLEPLNPPLLQAAAHGEQDRLHALLDSGCDVEQADPDGRTALMMGAQFGHAGIVSELLARGAVVDRTDGEGNTALLLAARSGCVEAVEDLLLWKAEIDHTNRKGQTALYLAAACPVLRESKAVPWSRHKGHDEVVRALLGRFANTEFYEIGGMQPVSAAAHNGNVVATLELLEAGARFLSDEMVGPNLLCSVAGQGNVDAVRLLLDRGAAFFDIDGTGAPGERTALSCAASARHYGVARELLDRGAIASEADLSLFDAWIGWLEAEAEDAYDRMYDGMSAAGHYSNAKDYLADAISLSRRIGRAQTAARLEARLDHIKAVSGRNSDDQTSADINFSRSRSLDADGRSAVQRLLCRSRRRGVLVVAARARNVNDALGHAICHQRGSDRLGAQQTKLDGVRLLPGAYRIILSRYGRQPCTLRGRFADIAVPGRRIGFRGVGMPDHFDARAAQRVIGLGGSLGDGARRIRQSVGFVREIDLEIPIRRRRVLRQRRQHAEDVQRARQQQTAATYRSMHEAPLRSVTLEGGPTGVNIPPRPFLSPSRSDLCYPSPAAGVVQW